MKLHNRLGESRYSLSLVEQKFFIYAVTQINQDKKDFEIVNIKIKDFAKYAEVSEKTLYREVDKITDNVMKLILKTKEENGDFEKYNLTSKCKFVRKTGTIIFKFNIEMKPLLLQLKTHYMLQHPEVIRFKSWYSIRIYDLLKSTAYKQTKFDKEKFVYSVDDLRELLETKKKYPRFNSLRQVVISPAIKEINEKTNLYIEYKTIKKGANVVALEFYIEDTMLNKTVTDEYLNLYDKKTIKDIRKGCRFDKFNDKQIIELYEIAVEMHEENPYAYVIINKKYMENKKDIKNKFGYLKKALTEDYANAKMLLNSGMINLEQI